MVSDPDDGDALRLEVEARPLGTAFTGVPTGRSAPVLNEGRAVAAVTGLAANGSYHWQARTADETGRASAWQPFGGNAEAAPDFSTSIPEPPAAPTGLGQFQSDGSTAIPAGGTARGEAAVFRATVTDPDPGDALRLEVEVKPGARACQQRLVRHHRAIHTGDAPRVHRAAE